MGRPAGRPRRSGVLGGLLLGGGLTAVAFVARGGSALERTTTATVAIVVVAGLFAAVALAYARPGRLPGAPALVLFGLLTAVTALSITWSISPEDSWIETNRTLSYFLVFAAALGAARLSTRAWKIVLAGLLFSSAAVVIYAVVSRVWPGALAAGEIYARLGQPLDYWNAVGAVAALAIPPTLWVGARRSGHAAANALAYPLLGLIVVVLFLSYSRGALLAAIIGVALWLAVVPLRLRSLTVLGVSLAGAAPAVAWALSKDAFTRDYMPVLVRESVGPEFGLLLLTMSVVLLAAGLAIGFRLGRKAPSITFRRRLGVAAVAAACAVPLLGFGGLATSERGLAGTVGAQISSLTSETATTAGGPARLTQASSTRGRYWRQAGRVYGDSPAVGSGAGTFAFARLKYRSDDVFARHAHGYLPQTLADLGVVGLVLSLALAVAWLVATGRTVGLYPRALRRPWSAERVGAAALAGAAVVYAIHSAVDWTWFVPGPTVMAMAAAGFVAGRGTLAPAGGAPAGAEPGSVTAVPVRATGATPGPTAPQGGLARLVPSRDRILLGVAALLTTALCVWAVLQPERSEELSHQALAQIDEGTYPEAARTVNEARRANPLSAQPLLAQAALEAAQGRPETGVKTLESAVALHQNDPSVWVALADFQLHQLDRPLAALNTLRAALYLDPRSKIAQSAFIEARARLRAQDAPNPQPRRPTIVEPQGARPEPPST